MSLGMFSAHSNYSYTELYQLGDVFRRSVGCGETFKGMPALFPPGVSQPCALEKTAAAGRVLQPCVGQGSADTPCEVAAT